MTKASESLLPRPPAGIAGNACDIAKQASMFAALKRRAEHFRTVADLGAVEQTVLVGSLYDVEMLLEFYEGVVEITAALIDGDLSDREAIGALRSEISRLEAM